MSHSCRKQKKYSENTKVVFFGPCIVKKAESDELDDATGENTIDIIDNENPDIIWLGRKN